MLCEWRRVRGEHPPPILARAPQGARAFIFDQTPLCQRAGPVCCPEPRAAPRPGALTVWGVFFVARARNPFRATGSPAVKGLTALPSVIRYIRELRRPRCSRLLPALAGQVLLAKLQTGTHLDRFPTLNRSART